jgi:FkbM family methyltransferase
MNTVLLAKMFLDRRKHRGASEFRFRWRPPSNGWQRFSVAARDVPFCVEANLQSGTSDAWVFEQVFCNNDYNLRRLARWHDIARTYDTLRRSGSPLILDIGANIGLASLYFAKNWPAARILAVEPSERNYEVLCRNVSGLNNVSTVRAAVASTDGFVNIVNSDGEAWAHRTELATGSSIASVAAKSVKSLIASLGGNDVNLRFICKIDIEGFESNLYSANTEWVRLFPIIIIELHDWMLPKGPPASE